MQPFFKKIIYISFPLIALRFVACNVLMTTNDLPPPPNVLSIQDSIAIRRILDANGLDTVKVKDVIDLQRSSIVQINIQVPSLHQFVFNKYFDSLESSPGWNLANNNIDTLFFPDTISRNLGIDLDHNNLRAIPGEIENLRGGIALYVNNNQINSISPKIMQCNVSYINVNYNQLCNIPDSMTHWIIKNCRDSATWSSTQACQ